MTTTDDILSRLARPRHGIVNVALAARHDVSPKTLAEQVRRSRAVRIHRGVYLIGVGPFSERSCWMAATDAAGCGAALSGWAAARLWDLSPWRIGTIDVVVPGRRRHLNGVRVHQSRSLLTEDVTVVDGIPVVTVERLLVELADTCSVGRLCRIMDRAQYTEVLDRQRLARVMRRHASRRGHARLRNALAMFDDDGTGTRSRFEEETARRVIDVPGVRRQVCTGVRIAGLSLEPDLHYPDLGLMVEIDDPTHDQPAKRRMDQSNDRRLAAVGVDVMRVHWSSVDQDVARANEEIVRRCEAAGITVPPRCRKNATDVGERRATPRRRGRAPREVSHDIS